MKLFLILLFLNLKLMASEVSFSIIKTGEAHSKEFLIYHGGDVLRDFTVNHSAILIKHENEYILFDTGLGSNIDEQYEKGMPWWGKQIFKYEKGIPAITQLKNTGIEIKNIYLSHLHWDHASALSDFPLAFCNIVQSEYDELYDPINSPNPAAFLKSQFNFPQSRWKTFEFFSKKFMGFDQSFDIFNDQSAVLVPLPGHSKGSVGLILTTSKKKYFFIGDLVWSTKAIKNLSAKFFLASKIVDGNRLGVKNTMGIVREFMKKYPEVEIIPAHDEEVQSKIGYFPNWVTE